jgi:hypothetical protein
LSIVNTKLQKDITKLTQEIALIKQNLKKIEANDAA